MHTKPDFGGQLSCHVRDLGAGIGVAVVGLAVIADDIWGIVVEVLMPAGLLSLACTT